MLGLWLLHISRAIDRRSAVVADVVDVAADETLYLFLFIYFFVVARALQAAPKQNIAHGAHDFAPDTDAPAVFEESINFTRETTLSSMQRAAPTGANPRRAPVSRL